MTSALQQNLNDELKQDAADKAQNTAKSLPRNIPKWHYAFLAA